MFTAPRPTIEKPVSELRLQDLIEVLGTTYRVVNIQPDTYDKVALRLHPNGYQKLKDPDLTSTFDLVLAISTNMIIPVVQ